MSKFNLKSGLLFAALGMVALGFVLPPQRAYAFEAHIVQVKATLNPEGQSGGIVTQPSEGGSTIGVNLSSVNFGTVHPQELIGQNFLIVLSESFLSNESVRGITYDIVQRPNEINSVLCPYLAKLPQTQEQDDIAVASPHEEQPYPLAHGVLDKNAQDTSDEWRIEFKVPGFEGEVAQDYDPQVFGTPLPQNLKGQTFGCDLWVEVKTITESTPTDSVISSSPAPHWQQTLGNSLDFSVTNLEIRVKNSGDTFYAGDLYGYLKSDYTSDYPAGYGIPPVEHYSFMNLGSSTPSGFEGSVTLTTALNWYGPPSASFPLNPNRYYKFSINGGDLSRAFQVYGSASDTYSNGKAYYSYSSYPCPSPLFNPEEVCEPGMNNGIADIFFRFGTGETLSGTEYPVATGIDPQFGPTINGDIIAWIDYPPGQANGDIYAYEISTGREILVSGDHTALGGPIVADRKILWLGLPTNPVAPSDGGKSTFIYNLDTGEKTEITGKTGSSIDSVDFDGQRVVWGVGYPPGRIYLYDIDTDELTLVDADDPLRVQDSVRTAKISGNNILYQWTWICGIQCSQEELRLYNIQTGEKTQVCGNLGYIRDFSIDGDNIICIYLTSPAGQQRGIVWHKISTGQKVMISPLLLQTAGVAISGNKVVWSDQHDIFIYDLATGKTGRVTSGAGMSRFYPKVSQNNVVWEDYRAGVIGNPNVYRYQLDGQFPQNIPPTFSLLTQSKVNGGDIDEGASIRDNEVTFSAHLDDVDSDNVRLQVELRQLNQPDDIFSGLDDGGILTSEFVIAGNIATITRSGLVSGFYRWRARAVDESGAMSEWTEFEIAGNIDFEIMGSYFVELNQGQQFRVYYQSLRSGEFGQRTPVFSARRFTDIQGDLVIDPVLGARIAKAAYVYEKITDPDFEDSIQRSYDGANTMIVSYLGVQTIEAVDECKIRITSSFFVGPAPLWSCLKSIFIDIGILDSLTGENALRVTALVFTEVLKQNYNDILSVTDPVLHNGWVLNEIDADRIFDLAHQGTFEIQPLSTDLLFRIGEMDNTIGEDAWNILTRAMGELIDWAGDNASQISQEVASRFVPIDQTEETFVDILGYIATLNHAKDYVDSFEHYVNTLTSIFEFSNALETYRYRHTLDIALEAAIDDWGARTVLGDDAIYRRAEILSPGELRVYDAQGRVTGLVNGVVHQEIPLSYYSEGRILLFDLSQQYVFSVVGTEDGKYGLVLYDVNGNEIQQFNANFVPTTLLSIHTYEIDWDNLSQGGNGVILTVDRNGDGVIEKTVVADTNLTGEEFNAVPSQSTFLPIADTYVRQGMPNKNQGEETFLRVRAAGDNRALIKFDQETIHDIIGSGEVISAYLELQTVRNQENWGKQGRTIEIYRLVRDWSEYGATWNCSTDTNPGNARADCPGNGWDMGKPKRQELYPWVASPTDSVLITNNTDGTIIFDVTEDVKSFLNGTPDHGWIVKKEDENKPGLVEFGSRENDASPVLVIVYQ